MDVLPFDYYVASLNRKRNSAAAVFYDADGRVLLVEPTHKPHLDLPGGAVEADEPPWQAVAREVYEELGLRRTFAAPVVIDYTPTNERLSEGFVWVFDGGSVTESQAKALELTDPEIGSVALHHLDEVTDRTKPDLVGRITVALEVVNTGGFALCGTIIRYVSRTGIRIPISSRRGDWCLPRGRPLRG
ncbi:NUDIX domain-containing protein [Sciscionella marina]|uniref:NUDIX domain-containing protein n=1 Tax=Sciscionella marina TaxID=508770 RepID=UPI00037B429F|nr:NUDIX hydrolase [Sciscionella marina]